MKSEILCGFLAAVSAVLAVFVSYLAYNVTSTQLLLEYEKTRPSFSFEYSKGVQNSKSYDSIKVSIKKDDIANIKINSVWVHQFILTKNYIKDINCLYPILSTNDVQDPMKLSLKQRPEVIKSIEFSRLNFDLIDKLLEKFSTEFGRIMGFEEVSFVMLIEISYTDVFKRINKIYFEFSPMFNSTVSLTGLQSLDNISKLYSQNIIPNIDDGYVHHSINKYALNCSPDYNDISGIIDYRDKNYRSIIILN